MQASRPFSLRSFSRTRFINSLSSTVSKNGAGEGSGLTFLTFNSDQILKRHLPEVVNGRDCRMPITNRISSGEQRLQRGLA